MGQKKVLVASYHLWNWCFRGGVHFLTQFFINKGYQVAFITIPFSIFTIFNGYKTRKSRKVPLSLSSWLRDGQSDYNGRFISYVPFSLIHPADALPGFLKNIFCNDFVINHFLDLSIPSLKKWLKEKGFHQPDILMVESGLPIAVSKIVCAKNIICRISDDISDLGRSEPVVEFESKFYKKVDILLPVSRDIYDSAIKRRGSDNGVYLLPNGVEIEIFQKKAPEPPEYLYIPKPRAVYIGGISEDMIDFELLHYTAKNLSDVSFVIIGPYNKIPLDEIPSNLYFLGGRPYQDIPPYLQNADVGLIPFQKSNKRFNKVEYPVKFYQYLASGLPVVSVDCGKLKAMEPYASVVKTCEEFCNSIRNALNKDQKYRNHLIDTAQKFSWKNIYSCFETILLKHGILD